MNWQVHRHWKNTSCKKTICRADLILVNFSCLMFEKQNEKQQQCEGPVLYDFSKIRFTSEAKIALSNCDPKHTWDAPSIRPGRSTSTGGAASSSVASPAPITPRLGMRVVKGYEAT